MKPDILYNKLGARVASLVAQRIKAYLRKLKNI